MRHLAPCLLAALAVMAAAPVPSPAVQMLRVQKTGGHAYFHVRFAEPEGLTRILIRDKVAVVQAPRLVPQDGNARLVAPRIAGVPDLAEARHPMPVRDLEFVGRCEGKRAAFALHYPVKDGWRSASVILDFARAAKVAVPREAAARRKPAGKEIPLPPVADDLEGLWAVAQRDAFRRRAGDTPAFGYDDFAARSLSRRFGVAEGREEPQVIRARGERPSLYDLTTGAAAMAETLQMERMRTLRKDIKDEKRTEKVADLPGIKVAEHPWKKMMAGKKPAPEPLAGMVPADNWYVAFKRADKMAEFAGQMRSWGGSLLSQWQPQSRDARDWQRYERQLCLTLQALPAADGVALTGSDAYLREGSDVTLIVRAADPKALDVLIEKVLAKERKDIGDRLREREERHEGVAIRSAVSPGREVSLYRARLGETSLFSNSPAGIRRVIDAARGKRKRLSASLDFQYMRTVFRADDKTEDGFAFLSDPFIRRMVGPAMKIKQRRRLEGLASLRMLTNGAMLAQWESGQPAATMQDILNRTGLKTWELPMPEGLPVSWDAERQTALSDAYGTLRFATPLAETHIDRVTPTEAQEYETFRREYSERWRQYFDPMGFRVSMAGGETKLEAYILPLIENSAYGIIRRLTGSGAVKLHPSRLSSKTLVHFAVKLNGDVRERSRAWNQLGNGGVAGLLGTVFDPLGERMTVRLDDGPAVAKMLDLLDRQRRGERVDALDAARQAWELPLSVGFEVKNRLAAAAWLAAGRTALLKAGRGLVAWEPLEKEYKSVSIVRIQATKRGEALLALAGEGESFRPAVYYAVTGRGLFFTLNEKTLHGLIDEATSKKPAGEAVPVAMSLHLSPGRSVRPAIKGQIAQAIHEEALKAAPLWHALYSSGVVPAGATPAEAAEAAYRWLGFVPVSPDGSVFRWDAKAGEVVNERHGTRRLDQPLPDLLSPLTGQTTVERRSTIRKPVVPKTMRKGSPPDLLFDSLESVRADLRFREDGIHATVTMKRKKP